MMGHQGGSNAVARWLRFAVWDGDDGDERVFAQVATPNSVGSHSPPPPFHPQASARADAACTPLAFARRTYAASPPPYTRPGAGMSRQPTRHAHRAAAGTLCAAAPRRSLAAVPALWATAGEVRHERTHTIRSSFPHLACVR